MTRALTKSSALPVSPITPLTNECNGLIVTMTPFVSFAIAIVKDK